MAQHVETETPQKTVETDGHPAAGGERAAQPASAHPPASYAEPDVYRERKSRLKVIIPLAVIVLLVAGLFVGRYYAQWESTDDAQIDGYINPISSRVSGYVVGVNVDDNQYVKAGTVLVEIDRKDYQVALDSAKAALANDQASAKAAQVNVPITSVNTSSQLRTAEADVTHARAGIAAAEKQLQGARASLAQSEANNAKAQDDVNRYKLLVSKNEISEQQYTQAVDNAKATEAAVAAARASVAATEDQVAQARSRLTQAEAEVQSALTGPRQVSAQRSRALAADAMVQRSKAALDQAQLNLQYTTIVAPVSGIVDKRAVQVGQSVTPGQPLMSIIQIDNIWVTANFKETQLKKMRPGQGARIRVDAYDRDYNGHVESIAGGTGAVFSLLPPENATGNYVKVVQRVPIKIVFDKGQDPEHLLRPGMSVVPKVKVN